MFPKRHRLSVSRLAGRLLLAVAGCVVVALAPAGAQAAVDLSVRAPSLAGGLTVPVGHSAEGQIDVTNGTTAPEWVKPFIVKQITLVPSCGAAAADQQCHVAPGPDPGVITIADKASGSGACSGTIFDVTVIDALSGRVSFTPPADISLSANGAGATCTITFTYTVQHMPTKDSGNAPGWQTDLIAYASGYQGGQTIADDPGTTKVTACVTRGARDAGSADRRGRRRPLRLGNAHRVAPHRHDPLRPVRTDGPRLRRCPDELTPDQPHRHHDRQHRIARPSCPRRRPAPTTGRRATAATRTTTP